MGQGTATVKKVTTGNYTGLLLMQKSAYPVCKKFLGPLPKPLYSSLKLVIVQHEHIVVEGFL